MRKYLYFFIVLMLIISTSFSFADNDPFIVVPSPISFYEEGANYYFETNPPQIPKHYISYLDNDGKHYILVALDKDGFIKKDGAYSTVNNQSMFYFRYDSDGVLRASGGRQAIVYDIKQVISSSSLSFAPGQIPDEFDLNNSWGSGGGQSPPQLPQTTTALADSVGSSIKSLVQLGVLLMGFVLLVLLLLRLFQRLLGFSPKSRSFYH